MIISNHFIPIRLKFLEGMTPNASANDDSQGICTLILVVDIW